MSHHERQCYSHLTRNLLCDPLAVKVNAGQPSACICIALHYEARRYVPATPGLPRSSKKNNNKKEHDWPQLRKGPRNADEVSVLTVGTIVEDFPRDLKFTTRDRLGAR